MKTTQFILSLFLLISFNSSILKAQNWDQTKKVTADYNKRKVMSSFGRENYENFGNAVSIDGNYAVVGCYNDGSDTDGLKRTLSGAVYVYRYDSGVWKQIQKLTANDTRGADEFGYSVAIKGDYIVVGAPKNDFDTSNSNYVDRAGAAYIFKLVSGEWIQVKKMVSDYRNLAGSFGFSVSISENFILVGSHNEDFDVNGNDSILNAGLAYMYELNSGQWVFNSKIESEDRETYGTFGFSVDLTDEYAMIGAPAENYDTNSNNSLNSAGAVYIFKNNSGTWIRIIKLVPSDRASFDYFGTSVAIDSANAVVGTFKNLNAGAAYVFKLSSGRWIPDVKLLAKVRAAGDYFSYSVDIDKETIVIGAYQEDQDSADANTMNNAGSAYIFKKNTNGIWQQIKKLCSHDRFANDNFAQGVAIYQNIVICGAPNSDKDTASTNFVSNAGSAYFFTLKNGNWEQDQKVVSNDFAIRDYFGFSVSMNGKYAISGSPFEDEDFMESNSIYNAGAAFILYNDSGNWIRTQKLTPNKRNIDDNFGFTVCINGDYAMVSAPRYDFDSSGLNKLDNSGAVFVFQNINNKWVQIQTLTPKVRGNLDEFGYKILMIDSFAYISAPSESEDAYDNNTLSFTGSVYVFKLNAGRWIQYQKIVSNYRQTNVYFGSALSVSKNTLAIGSMYNNLNDSNLNNIYATGAVYLFEMQSDTWRFSQKIVAPNRTSTAFFGNSVSIQNNILAVGAMRYKDANKPGYSGAVYLFYRENSRWFNKNIIYAYDSSNNVGQFGKCVILDKNMLYVSGDGEALDKNSSNYKYLSGMVYQIKVIDSNTTCLINKIEANDRDQFDQFGMEISLNDNFLIVGAPYEDEDSTQKNPLAWAGSVYIYKKTNCDTNKIVINTTACNSYTSLSNKSIWTKSGIYIDTIDGKCSCDSIFEVHLTIINSSYSSINITNCDSFISPSMKYVWRKTGTYNDTLKNYIQCDSIITINLQINIANSERISITACDKFTSPSLKYIWKKSGEYSDTIKNYLGCDSIIIIDLTIDTTTKNNISITACDNYSSPSGKYLWSASGLYMDTIKNSKGCDSILTINLKINQKKLNSIDVNSCNSYSSPSGKYTWNSSGVYKDTLISFNACDSILSINLEILKPTFNSIKILSCNPITSISKKYIWSESGTYQDTIVNHRNCDSIISVELIMPIQNLDTVKIQSCRFYTSVKNGQKWTKSGIYFDTLSNYFACDSIVILNLNITNVYTGISVTSSSLISNSLNSNYQWLDCSNNYSTIQGETNRIFNPTKSGKYAVEIDSNNCKDTSKCIDFQTTNVSNIFDSYNFKFYPNPNSGEFTIYSETDAQLEIYDLYGRLIFSGPLKSGDNSINISSVNSGIYLITVKYPEGKNEKQFMQVIHR